MKGFFANIEQDTLENQNFRKVEYTGKQMQLVTMSLLPKEEIGTEIHHENDQFFRFEAGEGKVLVDGTEYLVSDGSAVIIPAGAEHNVINTSSTEPLKMYTLYAPSHHKNGVIHATKAIAEQAELDGTDEFDGQTTE
ncbi:MAG: cupin domain-containing protein [Candidatus Absconditabacteria bacterium]|nr:cupin domain-containing protein [Candidatus Absconditabacteria bacterium]MDD3867981.1 cupin domain-containing protein [Candidatus Absconditabacteria bacterium]MDD4714228.1 cupin domain-containing protein [Candidatus Absconditabacteria bacterium]